MPLMQMVSHFDEIYQVMIAEGFVDGRSRSGEDMERIEDQVCPYGRLVGRIKSAVLLRRPQEPRP